MAFMATSDFEDINTSVFEQSSPESLRSRTFSPPAHDHASSTSSGPTLHNEVDDDYFGSKVVKQCASNRSSISSFPSSVIHTIQFTDNEDYGSRTPSRSQLLSNGRNSPTYKVPSNSYLSAFRHPNSVRALQLESEYADSDSYSVARSPRNGRSPKLSYFSPRSPGSTQSSPTKRSSRPGTPQQKKSSSKLKKEFPLVLLHCTLLPPTTTTRGISVSEEILEAVLPEEFRKSWRTLQDKVAKNNEVKQRGVLIAHPRDDYDLLEERLLEALELERPRIRKGHYIGTSKSGSDSGFESSSQNDTDEGSDVDERDGEQSKDKCPDCGKAVSCKIEQDRKWEIKIFAANGLMRSGAWSAAWEQMEKIDVEVAVWMPEDVRFEVEERLRALQAKEEAERLVEEPVDPPKKKRTRSNTAKIRHDQRMREIYGQPEKTETPEVIQEPPNPVQPEPVRCATPAPTAQEDIDVHTEHIPPESIFIPPPSQQHDLSQADFLTFMKHHFYTIIHDQRNLAIVLLSMLVLFFSVQNLNTSTTSATDVVKATTTPMATTTETPTLGATAASRSQVTSVANEQIPSALPTSLQTQDLQHPESAATVQEDMYPPTSRSSSEVESDPDQETETNELSISYTNQSHLLDLYEPAEDLKAVQTPNDAYWVLSLFKDRFCVISDEQS